MESNHGSIYPGVGLPEGNHIHPNLYSSLRLNHFRPKKLFLNDGIHFRRERITKLPTGIGFDFNSN